MIAPSRRCYNATVALSVCVRVSATKTFVCLCVCVCVCVCYYTVCARFVDNEFIKIVGHGQQRDIECSPARARLSGHSHVQRGIHSRVSRIQQTT